MFQTQFISTCVLKLELISPVSQVFNTFLYSLSEDQVSVFSSCLLLAVQVKVTNETKLRTSPATQANNLLSVCKRNILVIRIPISN